jgi:hypothetical protein
MRTTCESEIAATEAALDAVDFTIGRPEGMLAA